jgi:hypothetical protein
MGLFDSYFDPDQFQDSDGLLGRLLSLQPQRDLQAGAGFGLQRTGDSQPSSLSQISAYPPIANAAQDINSQYQALRPLLGERNAMLAIVHPEAGQALIARALARQQNTCNSGDTNSADKARPTAPVETSKNCRCGGCAA